MRSHKSWIAPIIFALFGFLSSCGNSGELIVLGISSPSGNIKVSFFLTSEQEPAYKVTYRDELIIDTSLLGFDLKDSPSLKAGFRIQGYRLDSLNETWEQPWGEQRNVVNHFNEITVNLQETGSSKRMMDLVFRVFDDGIGFRYNFPEQDGFTEAIILEENTRFNLAEDYESWWQPGDWDSYEHLFNHTRISEIDAKSKFDPGIIYCYIPENSVFTPITMKTQNGTYLSIHEADLTDYPAMTLIADTSKHILTSGLVDSERLGWAAKCRLPFHTPWRTIQIADKPGDLVESKLILNLNEPNKLGDVSWIKPMKYAGIWWEMHLGKSGWDMEGGKHGATTKNAEKYIDFAAENKFGGVLVEGWNTGWKHWVGFHDREGVFDFVTPYADYDLDEVVRYAKQKGVEIIIHHETAAAPRTYEQQMDSAFKLMQKLDLHSAKLGYVGQIIPDGEHQQGQWMVNHYRKVVETAAKYKVAVDIHEPVKPTGLRRTYPNLISGEAVRGQEFNAWSADGGNPPDHLTIVPFTRMLAGPIDYTPGIFDLKLKPFRPNNRVNSTLAQQLALYVIIYSPVQMVADLPENYNGKPALQFIRDVPVDWEQSLVLDAEIGDYVCIARQERGIGNWFLGAITDENSRELNIDFNFLEEGKNYSATIYKDGKDADWDKNPYSFAIEKVNLTKSSELNLNLAPGGGVAISIILQP